MSFMVRRGKAKNCRIFYSRRPEFETAEEKLAFLGSAKLRTTEFEEVRSDAKYNWINLTQNDFDGLVPIATKQAMAAQRALQEKAIFKLYSFGVVTNRDHWFMVNLQKRLSKRYAFSSMPTTKTL
ncbi:MAG TPA: hypothetical protein VLA17_11330 [Candidatus Limnocylindria bacterium]|nr:hypothetical protein [Candidatus Limnocylindria bacterium]